MLIKTAKHSCTQSQCSLLLIFYRYKGLSFLSVELRAVVMDRVYDLLEGLEAEREAKEKESRTEDRSVTSVVKVEPGTATVTAAVDGPPKKKQKKSLQDRMLGEVTDLTVPAENLRKEVQEYVGAMVKAGQTPLQWWAIHSVSYPNVAELARSYLAIPPTEVIKCKFINLKT